jgi:condensin complex subunit 3
VWLVRWLMAQSEPEDFDATPARETLCHVLQHDLSAEVRRRALAVLPLDDATLPLLLARARDTDANVRALVFRKAMEELPDVAALSIEDRNVLLACGLADRCAAPRRTRHG